MVKNKTHSKSHKTKAVLSEELTRIFEQSLYEKKRKLANKEILLNQLRQQLKSGNYHQRCFGSKKLMWQGQQLSLPSNEEDKQTDPDNAFTSLAGWNQEFFRRKYCQATLIGKAAETLGNPDIKINLLTNTIAIRLTAKQVVQRLQSEAAWLGCSIEQVPHQLQLKRLVLPIDIAPKLKKQLLQAQQLKIPITIQLTCKTTPKGQKQLARGEIERGFEETAWYVHASFDLPAKPIQHSRTHGVLGIDCNAWGLAWCIAKPDGNIMKDPGTGQHLTGNVYIDVRQHHTANQIQTQLRQAVVEITTLAEKYHIAMAIEDLDFSQARSSAKEQTRAYARMITQLRTAKLKEAFQSRCRKRQIALHLVDPSWTSLGGFIKYGMLNSFSVDQAAAFAIARCALFAKLWQPLTAFTHNKEGKPYSAYYIGKQQKSLDEKRKDQVLHHSESCRPAIQVPLFHSLNTALGKQEQGFRAGSQDPVQMKQSHTVKAAWVDWKCVLGVDRSTWVSRMLNPSLVEKELSKLSKPKPVKSKAVAKAIANPEATITSVRSSTKNLFTDRTSVLALANPDFWIS